MHTLKLILYWSTFWFYYTTQSFCVWIYQHGTSWLRNICPLFFAKMLQICQIARHLLCTALFRSPTDFQWDSGLGSGWVFFWWSHSFVDLDVCFGLLSCWKMKFLFIFSFLAEAWRFCTSIDWYMELFIIPSTLTKSPGPAEEEQP